MMSGVKTIVSGVHLPPTPKEGLQEYIPHPVEFLEDVKIRYTTYTTTVALYTLHQVLLLLLYSLRALP